MRTRGRIYHEPRLTEAERALAQSCPRGCGGLLTEEMQAGANHAPTSVLFCLNDACGWREWSISDVCRDVERLAQQRRSTTAYRRTAIARRRRDRGEPVSSQIRDPPPRNAGLTSETTATPERREGKADDVDNCDKCDREQFIALMEGVRVGPECGATDEEMETLIGWAHRVHIRTAILELLLQGSIVVISFRGEEPVFGTPEAADMRDAVAAADQIVRE